MKLTDQTKSDLKSILETLDQRLHEITGDPAMKHEAAALQGLRENASKMIAAG